MAVLCVIFGFSIFAAGEDLLYGTIAADTLAIAAGTDFIRVHHVKEAKLAAKMTDALTRGESHG